MKLCSRRFRLFSGYGVHIEPAAVEVDGVDEVLPVAKIMNCVTWMKLVVKLGVASAIGSSWVVAHETGRYTGALISGQ